jgi:hypothetical protein
VQTVPGYSKGLMDGMPKVLSQEGVGGCAPRPAGLAFHALGVCTNGRADACKRIVDLVGTCILLLLGLGLCSHA